LTPHADIPPVTVLVPCLNEETGIPALLTRLRALRQDAQLSDWHFLFIDDGSSDGTFSELLRAERDEPWIEVLRHHENLGLGAALRTGFAHSKSPIICSMDSDCTYPPERLPELTELVRRGVDIATASAWHPESAAAEGARIRLLLSWGVSRIYKTLVGQDVYTFTCLFRAYRREVVERIRFHADGFSGVAELMLRALLAGYTIAEVPMRLEPRRYGESKLRIADAVLAHMALLTMTAAMVSSRHVRRAIRKGAAPQG
jgi:dolichol-phosphate mannosyltransferase